MSSFIILDRDGVINYDSDNYIKSPEEWRPIPRSLEAVAALNRAGYRVVIATNQAGISRGLYDVSTLDCIHEKMADALAQVGGYVEEIFFCPHHPDAHCSCRKPEPGLLYQAQKKYKFNLAETYFIGDSYKDIKAGQTAGCKRDLAIYPDLKYVQQAEDLADGVSRLLTKS